MSVEYIIHHGEFMPFVEGNHPREYDKSQKKIVVTKPRTKIKPHFTSAVFCEPPIAVQ